MFINMDKKSNRINTPGTHRNSKPVKLNPPSIVGYMSVDGARQYHSNLSQLKFLSTAIPRGDLHLDLNHNVANAVKRTTDENGEKIDLLLTYLLDQKDQIRTLLPNNKSTFITYRRTLISVMCSAFKFSDPIKIIACLYKNCIYLCSIETQEDITRRKSRSLHNQRCCAWGYKFEQFILSDLPSTVPHLDKPVVENEEFSIYYHSEIGDHNLLYGAQIDGMLTTNMEISEPPNTNDHQTNLNYLRNNNCYLELKTNREICNRRQEQNFRRFKLLRCWCQCYLAGLKGLLVGFRSDAGIVNRVQWLTTEEIATHWKFGWDPQTALSHLDYFLTYIEKAFEVYITNNNMQEFSDPITLQFDVSYNNQIIVTNNFDNTNIILPDWYLRAMEK